MTTKVVIKTSETITELVPWLREHVGEENTTITIDDWVHGRWHGHGWSLEGHPPNTIEVTIDDEQMATLFLLRWS